MTGLHDRRSGATAAAGGDTATSLSVSAFQDASHLCICDLELRLLSIFDLRCPAHGLAATLRDAVRARKESE